MISWKYSFDLVCKELELTKRKKQALNDLLAAGRISQSTHEYLERELTEAILDLETHQKSLVDKMTARADALEKQIKSFELFLANLEVHHAAGEMDEETYNRQSEAITLGLEATKKELDDIKSPLMKIVSTAQKVPEATSETAAEVKTTEAISESIPESCTETKPIREGSVEGATMEETVFAESEPPTLVAPREEASTETGS